MLEKGQLCKPEWLSVPVEEHPPGGFPIVFAYSWRVWVYTIVLLCMIFCAGLLAAWELEAFSPSRFLPALALPLLLYYTYRNQNELQLYQEHFLFGLKPIPYRDIQSIWVQTTWAGAPIRTAVKLPTQTLHIEGIVCMDVFVRELVTRAKLRNVWMGVDIHRGPTKFQSMLFSIGIAAIWAFLLLNYTEAGFLVWTGVMVVTCVGVHIVLHFLQKESSPRPSDGIIRARHATTIVTIFMLLLPVIIIGFLFFVRWHSISGTP